MADQRRVTIDGPEASLLADLAGIEVDLGVVQEYCRRFLIERRKDNYDSLLVEALCAAALTRYGRILGSGARRGLPRPLIDELPPDLREVHDYCKEARDKWIAHSVNTFEDCQVFAILNDQETEAPGNQDLTVLTHRVIVTDSQVLEDLCRLAEYLEDKVRRLSEAEKCRLLELLRTQPIEQFYAMNERPPVLGHDHPQRVRPRK